MIFLIIILMFVPFCVLLAYLYAYVLFGVLNLSKKLSVKISFLVFYAIFILLILYFGFGAELFLAVPVMILSILILKRKQYFINFTKLKLAIASACLLVYAWQLEVPQKMVFKVATLIAGNSYPIVEIIDNNVSQDLMWRYGSTKELRDCQDKDLNCPFFNFKFPIYEVHAEVNGTNIVIAIEYNIAYSTSTLTRFLSSIGSTKRIEYQNTYKSVKSILNKGENNGTAK